MGNEDRWSQIGNITLKLALQINSLIDICEGQQKIIDNLTKRIEKLEGSKSIGYTYRERDGLEEEDY